MDQATVDEYLKSVYYDPKRPGSFGRIESLYRDVKQEGKFKLGRKQISDWLMSQDTYTLHKPALADLDDLYARLPFHIMSRRKCA